MKKRFIRSEDIPSHLWCGNSKKLSLPSKLVELWRELLEQNNLLGLAKEKAPVGFEGGISKEDTDKHLAWRYNGSCARVMLSILDPNNDLSEVSDAYSSTFAGNEVFLADLPSGSGAAIITILCTLFELRKSNVLPRHPLRIKIVAGEISPTARNYLIGQLDLLKPTIEDQAIWISYEVIDWNTLCHLSTADLIRRMTIVSHDCPTRLLILSNFTGFLEGSSKWNTAKKQFEQIFIHSRDLNSSAIWIEPQRNSVIPFYNRLVDFFKKSFKSLIGSQVNKDKDDWYAQSEIRCIQPIAEGDFRVNLTVIRFNLPMESQE